MVDAEVVEGLDPEDPWAPKIETITDCEDADAARADVETGVKAGHISEERRDAILSAIDARVASLSEQAAA